MKQHRQVHPPRLLEFAITAFILFALCMIVIFSSGCASSTLGKSLNVAVVGSGIADIATTRIAINSGLAREFNPVMGQGVWRQSLLKAAGSGVVIAGTRAVEKSKPVVAHVLRGLAIGVWTGLAISNARVGR